MSLDGNAGGANAFVDDELRNWGKRRFGRFGVSGDWEIQEVWDAGRFGEIRKFLNERKKLPGTPEESGDWKIPEIRKISGIRRTRRDAETQGIEEVREVRKIRKTGEKRYT